MRRQPLPFKQKPLAVAFTVGLHLLAIGGLIYFAKTELPEPPKPIKTVLVTPEQIIQTEEPQTQPTEIPAEKDAPTPEAPELAKTPEEINIPVTPPVVTNTESTRTIQLNKDAELAKLKAEKEAKAKADALAKQKADAKAKADADKRKAEADAKAKADAAKRKAEADAKAKADAAKRKAEADAKVKADADKRKAEADAKAKADADKRKAEADAKAKADAEAKAKAEKEAKEAAANKKAESKRIASTAKKDFENKIYRAWDVPPGTSGIKATARITLSDSGAVVSAIVDSSDPNVRASVKAAIYAAAPYPMPTDPDAKREARSINSTFIAK